MMGCLAGMLFYNSTLSIPMLAMAVLAASEPWGVTAYPLLFDRQFQVRQWLGLLWRRPLQHNAALSSNCVQALCR